MDDEIWHSGRFGIGAAGLCYILFFTPLCWLSALQQEFDFVRVLFLLEVPPHIELLFRDFILPKFELGTDLPFLSALAIFYGFACFSYLLLDFSLSGGKNFLTKGVHLVTTINGYFFGYLLTIGIAVSLLNVTDFDASLYRVYLIKFLYLYMIYIMFSAIRHVIELSGFWETQLHMLFDGLFGILSSLIIIVGFKEGLITLLTGPIFLVMVFLAMVVAEFLAGRPFAALSYTMLTLVSKPEAARHPDEHWKTFLSRNIPLLWQTFLAALKRPIKETISKGDSFLSQRRLDSAEDSEVIRLDKKSFAFAFLLFLIWPWPFVSLYIFLV